MLTWTLEETAVQFGRPVERFDHNHLIQKHGFPRPLPGFNKPLVFSRAAVRAWANQQLPVSHQHGELDGADAFVSAASALLDRHFEGRPS